MEPASFEMLARGGGQVRGYVPEFDLVTGKQRLVHWTQAPLDRTGKRLNRRVFKTVRVPEAIFDLPPIQRRSAQQKYEDLVRKLLDEMRRAKMALGRAEVPTSVRDQIQRAAWLEGDPTLLDRIEQAEPEAIEIYASFLMRDVANKQREKDQKKVALDWHGHYNA